MVKIKTLENEQVEESKPRFSSIVETSHLKYNFFKTPCCEQTGEQLFVPMNFRSILFQKWGYENHVQTCMYDRVIRWVACTTISGI